MESRSPDTSGDTEAGGACGIWWFALALVPLLGSQLMRLHQYQVAGWLGWDYAGRIIALIILAAIPAARSVAFQREQRRISLLEIGAWVAGIVLLDRLIEWPRRLLNATFPAAVVGMYPHPTGWLNVFDLVFGLALVALSEEIIFRRYLWNIAKPYFGDKTFAVLITSLMFGAYHWWSGIGNLVIAIAIGIALMVMYRRSGALWPVVLAHYLVDLIAFG